MRVDIVILHFGPLKTTQLCVESIFEKEPRAFERIIVVNNDQLQISENDFSHKGRVVIINNRKNYGFAKGVNIGIKYALAQGAESILLINNDAKLKKPLIGQLTKDLEENPEIGLISPSIEFRKGQQTLYDLGGYVNAVGKTRHQNVTRISKKTLMYPQYISGCCMLIRQEVFEKVGYFDERFFLYYEDVDFCLRATKKKWKIALDPSVILFHALSKSAGKGSKISIYYQTQSAILFGKKQFGFSFKRLGNIIFIFLQSNLFFLKNPKNGFAGFVAMIDTLFVKSL